MKKITIEEIENLPNGKEVFFGEELSEKLTKAIEEGHNDYAFLMEMIVGEVVSIGGGGGERIDFLVVAGLRESGVILFSLVNHYDLVEVEWSDGRVGHIPTPFFTKNEEGWKYLFRIKRSRKVRDEKFFTCPLCKNRGYYSGVCDECTSAQGWRNKNPDRAKMRKDNFLSAVLGGKRPPRTVKRVEYIFSA